MSTCPYLWRTWVANASTADKPVTLQAIPSQAGPCAESSSAAATKRSVFLAVTTTFAPSWASAVAIPKPIPRLPPVTTAMEPVRDGFVPEVISGSPPKGHFANGCRQHIIKRPRSSFISISGHDDGCLICKYLALRRMPTYNPLSALSRSYPPCWRECGGRLGPQHIGMGKHARNHEWLGEYRSQFPRL